MSLTTPFLARVDKTNPDTAIRKRIPYLVWLDILMFIYFPVSSFAKMRSEPEQYYFLFLNASVIAVCFLASLAILWRSHIYAAAYVTMFSVLAEVGNLALFTPSENWIDLYRVGAFLIGAMAVVNLAALKRWQIFAYYLSGLLITLSFVLLKALPSIGGFGKEGGTVIFLFVVLFTTTALVTLLLFDLNAALVTMAKSEAKANKERAEGLNALVSSVKEALETGKELVTAAGEGRSRSNEIRSRLDSLQTSARTLQERAVAVDAASVDALSKVEAAKKAAERQHEVISRAGEAMDGIDEAIREISSLAEAQRAASDSVTGLAERQRKEISDLTAGIERIRSSSAAVMEAAAGILDISEKTNLLAMNASIEAAHSGAQGRGFAVISGEIRKLSQDTHDGTKRIDEAVRANEATVAAQAEYMSRFTAGIDSMIADVKTTIVALGRMLDGLGKIGSAAGGLRSATGALQGYAREASDSVLGVAEGLRAGALSAAAAKDFAAELSSETDAMLAAFAVMETAVEKAATVGEKNLSRVTDLDSGLKEIRGDQTGTESLG